MNLSSPVAGVFLVLQALGLRYRKRATLAYQGIAQVQFEGMHHRTDIASAQRMRF